VGWFSVVRFVVFVVLVFGFVLVVTLGGGVLFLWFSYFGCLRLILGCLCWGFGFLLFRLSLVFMGVLFFVLALASSVVFLYFFIRGVGVDECWAQFGSLLP